MPLSELSPDAPDRYTVKRGDTCGSHLGFPSTKAVLALARALKVNLQQIRTAPDLPGQVLAQQGERSPCSSLDQGRSAHGQGCRRNRSENLAESANTA